MSSPQGEPRQVCHGYSPGHSEAIMALCLTAAVRGGIGADGLALDWWDGMGRETYRQGGGSGHSIRSIVIALEVTLVAVVAVVVLREATQQSADYRAARQIVEANMTADRLL